MRISETPEPQSICVLLMGVAYTLTLRRRKIGPTVYHCSTSQRSAAPARVFRPPFHRRSDTYSVGPIINVNTVEAQAADDRYREWFLHFSAGAEP